jgi:hypothetical protein
MKYALLALALVPSANALARHPATPDLAALLLAEAKPAIHTLAHDTIVFHYDAFDAPDTSYHPPNDPTGLADANSRIFDGVWNPSDQPKILNFTDWLGYGLYAATDPIASASYGTPSEVENEDQQMPGANIWRLLEITIAAGTPYLDVTQDISFSAALTQALQSQANCPANSLYELFLENRDDLVPCRAPMRELLKTDQIAGVLYHWGNFQGFVDNLCAKAPQAGFYLTSYPLTADNVHELTSVLPPDGADAASEDRLEIQEIWKRVGAAESLLPWPALSSSKPAQDVQDWVNAKLFGCGG